MIGRFGPLSGYAGPILRGFGMLGGSGAGPINTVVLSSAGTSYTVTNAVLASNGTSYNVT
jgi:hypothetical protein